jgi:hypothetical protein
MTEFSITPNRLTSASPNPQAAADIELDLLNAFQYTMPAYSVTTLVLVSDGIVGDFNRDGTVDAADYTVWRDHLGQNFALPNEDPNTTPGQVTAEDYDFWKTHFGQAGGGAGASAIAAVPEPATYVLLIVAAADWCLRRSRDARKSQQLTIA